jgi:hypothetical protein
MPLNLGMAFRPPIFERGRGTTRTSPHLGYLNPRIPKAGSFFLTFLANYLSPLFDAIHTFLPKLVIFCIVQTGNDNLFLNIFAHGGRFNYKVWILLGISRKIPAYHVT